MNLKVENYTFALLGRRKDRWAEICPLIGEVGVLSNIIKKQFDLKTFAQMFNKLRFKHDKVTVDVIDH